MKPFLSVMPKRHPIPKALVRISDVLVPTTISKRPRLPRSCLMNCVGSTWRPRISSNYFIIDSLVYSPHPKCLRDSFQKKKSAKKKFNSGESCRYRFRVTRNCKNLQKMLWSYAQRYTLNDTVTCDNESLLLISRLVAIGTSASQWKMRINIRRLSRNVALKAGLSQASDPCGKTSMCHPWGGGRGGLHSYLHVNIKQELSRQHVSSALFGFTSRYQPS